ncbi:HAD family hydrolase [Olsenella profusa]|uniref:HAD family phosphatase n=1 Tax=Olsenella profusa TaxID=138595 RepID=A0ABS2F416_9ACTN|nr:HAD family hydrolase [Olsenella profusa]MBM6775517.1 HAD family phosphatase [Olsenella profusa]
MLLGYEADTDLAGIRVVASDMDATLLADDKSMPAGMPERIRALNDAGVTFVAASGRPLYTLRGMFEGLDDEMGFVSDNGAAVVCRGEVVFKSLIAPETVDELLDFTLGRGLGIPTVCGLDACYVRTCDRSYDEFFHTFYRNIVYLDELEGLCARGVEVNKYTVYLPEANAVEACATEFAPSFGERLSVTCGGPVWVDVMNYGVDKGAGLARLCEHLGVSAADVAAFGDTDNDAQMLELVGHSYLMANAEARMEPHARFRAPSNNDRGVAVVTDRILAARRAQLG